MSEMLDTLFNQDLAEYEKYLDSNIKKKDLTIEDIIPEHTRFLSCTYTQEAFL